MLKMSASSAVVAVSIAVCLPGVATAEQMDARTRAPVSRPVLICASDNVTRRAFTREYGVAPVFVTAREALSLRPTDVVWTSPRCMTTREHSAYVYAITTSAVVR